MTHNNPESVAQNTISSTWWTPRRMKLAGFAGIIGGAILASLSISRTGLGIDPGAISQISPIGYALLIVALLAGHARYSSSYENGGRGIVVVLALSLASYAGSITILGITQGLLGIPLSPVNTLISIAFFGMRLFGTLYGIILWRQTNASRITAGLFAVVLPAVFVLGPLTLIGFPPLGIEAPLYLAFVALGFELLTADIKSSSESEKVNV